MNADGKPFTIEFKNRDQINLRNAANSLLGNMQHLAPISSFLMDTNVPRGKKLSMIGTVCGVSVGSHILKKLIPQKQTMRAPYSQKICDAQIEPIECSILKLRAFIKKAQVLRWISKPDITELQKASLYRWRNKELVARLIVSATKKNTALHFPHELADIIADFVVKDGGSIFIAKNKLAHFVQLIRSRPHVIDNDLRIGKRNGRVCGNLRMVENGKGTYSNALYIEGKLFEVLADCYWQKEDGCYHVTLDKDCLVMPL
jgi:hypothetical protein